MALDFQQVREQIQQWGESAAERATQLNEQRVNAWELLCSEHDLQRLCHKVHTIATTYDPNLRCAKPVCQPESTPEALNACHPLPPLPGQATILAADGSQIAPDRHAPVNYCLINVGAIQMRLGSGEAPIFSVSSQLIYDEQLYTKSGFITDGRLALMRDLNERQRLAELAKKAIPPVITFTDGPMELWGAKEAGDGQEFQDDLNNYQQALHNLQQLGVITCGYVDKPAANLVVRLLEIATLEEGHFSEVKDHYPLRGVLDRDLYSKLLEPGDRSAVFAMQSRSAQHYRDGLELHFFYLNAGTAEHAWPVRVEVPAWVALNEQMLDNLHATLIQQCRVMGARPYPYLLHRAHETAVVTWEEKEQVTQMIVQEMLERGVEVGETSHKQSAKGLAGRTSIGK